jgi:hypothetical protein
LLGPALAAMHDLLIAQFPVEESLARAVEWLAPRIPAGSLAAIAGTGPIHGEDKEAVAAVARATGSAIIRASHERRGRVGFLCRPDGAIESIYPGIPIDLGWTIAAIGLDDDIFAPEPAQEAASAGARVFLA